MSIEHISESWFKNKQTNVCIVTEPEIVSRANSRPRERREIVAKPTPTPSLYSTIVLELINAYKISQFKNLLQSPRLWSLVVYLGSSSRCELVSCPYRTRTWEWKSANHFVVDRWKQKLKGSIYYTRCGVTVPLRPVKSTSAAAWATNENCLGRSGHCCLVSRPGQ